MRLILSSAKDLISKLNNTSMPKDLLSKMDNLKQTEGQQRKTSIVSQEQRKNQIWRSFSFAGEFWLRNIKASKWSLEYDHQSLLILQGGDTLDNQHPGGNGEEYRVFQRDPGILTNNSSLISSLPSAAEGPTSNPMLVIFPFVVPKSRASQPLYIMVQIASDHVCSA